MSGKAPKSTSTTTSQTYSPEETAARDKLFSEGSKSFDAQNAAIQGSTNPSAVPVGPSDATTQAQNMYQSWAAGAGSDQARQLQDALKYGLTGAMDVNNNPHLQGAIDAATQATTRAYTDPNGVLANIRSDSMGNGQYGGTRQGLGEGVAAGRYLGEVGNIASTMSSAAYDKGQDTFARTLGLAPGTMQAQLQPGNALSAVGQQQEGYGAQQAAYDAAGRNWEMNKPFTAVQNYANLINGISSPSTTATNTAGGTGGGFSPMGALGGAASGAALGSMVMPGVGTAVGAGLGVLASLF